MTKRKAVALISGGLDSMLAAKIIQEQGVYVEGICFIIGFADSGEGAKEAARQLDIKLHLIDVIDDYRQIVLKPKYGYGANLNPCLDCKIFMVQRALKWAKKHGFDFVVTGEVVGQRAKSQRRDTMPIVAKESTANDLLVRPLCAKNLPETLPEREGWIKREDLYAISGRSRKEQLQLVKKFGFAHYAQPGGGCLLTEKKYCARLNDLWQARGKKDYSRDDVELLKIGRHLRPRTNFKMIIGRNEKENNILKNFKSKFISLWPLSHKGPLVVLEGDCSSADIELAAAVTGRFSGGRAAKEVIIAVQYPDGVTKELTVKPLTAQDISDFWYI